VRLRLRLRVRERLLRRPFLERQRKRHEEGDEMKGERSSCEYASNFPAIEKKKEMHEIGTGRRVGRGGE
jgi:hypothetical protein